MDLGNINFLAVLVGGVAAFALGTLWYTALFGKAWQAIVKLDEEKARSGMATTMILSFVLMTIMSFGMALLIQAHTDSNVDWLSGLYHGAAMGVLFAGMAIGINYLYQRKPFKLWLIDALYAIVFLSAQGAIIGAWPK
jgi:uncharacterized membrane protein required for colicin V production